MNKIFGSVMVIPLLLLGACTQEADELIENNDISSHADSSNPLIRYIKLKNGSTRSDEVSISPFVYENDTVMYVAQYTDGWELYSNDRRFPMTLLKREEGTFDVSKFSQPVNEEVMDMAAAIHQTKVEDPDMPTDESWSWLDPQFGEDEGIVVMSNIDQPDPANGKWVLIDIIDKGTAVYDIPHLVQTKWGQLYPWNIYTPYDSSKTNEHCAVGCVPVAAAQYAYFLHNKQGIPAYAPDFAIYQKATNSYRFTGIVGRGPWKNMAKKNSDTGTEKSAMFMGYVAGLIVDPDRFGADGTGATFKQAITRFLNPKTGIEFEEYKADGNYDMILTEIKSGYPVIASGYRAATDNPGQSYSVGHAFLIDSYRKETQTLEYVYGWEGKTISGADPNLYNEDGTIAYYGIQRRSSQSTETCYFRMNWGADGSDDDILSSPYSWKKGSLTPYSSKRSIILRK